MTLLSVEHSDCSAIAIDDWDQGLGPLLTSQQRKLKKILDHKSTYVLGVDETLRQFLRQKNFADVLDPNAKIYNRIRPIITPTSVSETVQSDPVAVLTSVSEPIQSGPVAVLTSVSEPIQSGPVAAPTSVSEIVQSDPVAVLTSVSEIVQSDPVAVLTSVSEIVQSGPVAAPTSVPTFIVNQPLNMTASKLGIIAIGIIGVYSIYRIVKKRLRKDTPPLREKTPHLNAKVAVVGGGLGSGCTKAPLATAANRPHPV